MWEGRERVCFGSQVDFGRWVRGGREEEGGGKEGEVKELGEFTEGLMGGEGWTESETL